MGRPLVFLIGQRFDKLKIRSLIAVTASGARWLCVCDCGRLISKLTTQLGRVGRTGCRSCERLSRSDAKIRHGGAKFGKSRLYRIWKSMRQRCGNPKDAGFKYYGGKGVRICPEWADFSVFRVWALAHDYREIQSPHRGERLSIERINPNGNYEPTNCEWITGSENSRRMAAAHRKVA